jgi:hypothetical protein
MSSSFPGDSPTPVGRPRKGRHSVKSEFIPVGSTLTRSERTKRLKDELQLTLELLTKVRGRLIAELATSKAADVSRDYTGRLKDVTACYADLTTNAIRLAQSEKKLGDELTPAEERDTAVEYILSLEPSERDTVIAYLITKSKGA